MLLGGSWGAIGSYFGGLGSGLGGPRGAFGGSGAARGRRPILNPPDQGPRGDPPLRGG